MICSMDSVYYGTSRRYAAPDLGPKNEIIENISKFQLPSCHMIFSTSFSCNRLLHYYWDHLQSVLGDVFIIDHHRI